MHRVILWFRNDLRLHDNPVVDYAVKTAAKKPQQTQVIPVFCFDPRFYTKAEPDFLMQRKSGVFRTKFSLESVMQLRQNLQSLGSGLLVSMGKPEEFLPQLVRDDTDTTVVFTGETCSEELEVEDRVEAAMRGSKLVDFWGNTLVHIDDVDDRIWDRFPQSSTAFMQKTDRVAVRPTLPTPKPGQLPTLDFTSDVEALASEFTPSLMSDFGFNDEEVQAAQMVDPRICLDFRGGENVALERLQHYFFGSQCLTEYKSTRNGMIGADYSSKFAPWLANGCLSVRHIYEELKKYEKQVAKNESTAHFYFELRWRDFFRYYCEAHQTQVFQLEGIRPVGYNGFNKWRMDPELIHRWKTGQTGMPIVDAFMRELNATGFMGNRGRQIVAAYLALDLQ